MKLVGVLGLFVRPRTEVRSFVCAANAWRFSSCVSRRKIFI